MRQETRDQLRRRGTNREARRKHYSFEPPDDAARDGLDSSSQDGERHGTEPDVPSQPELFGRNEEHPDEEADISDRIPGRRRSVRAMLESSGYPNSFHLFNDPISESITVRAKSKLTKSYLPNKALNAYLSVEPSIQISSSDYQDLIQLKLPRWRGTEHFLDVTPTTISLIFKSESYKWKNIANTHLNQVWAPAGKFVDTALKECVPAVGMREKLKKHLIDERLQRASRRHGAQAW
jgi:hypothetical protein